MHHVFCMVYNFQLDKNCVRLKPIECNFKFQFLLHTLFYIKKHLVAKCAHTHNSKPNIYEPKTARMPFKEICYNGFTLVANHLCWFLIVWLRLSIYYSNWIADWYRSIRLIILCGSELIKWNASRQIYFAIIAFSPSNDSMF